MTRLEDVRRYLRGAKEYAEVLTLAFKAGFDAGGKP